jgi:amidophosphoribosyltransferase
MSRMDEFIAFKAAIELLREKKKEDLILDTYHKAKNQQMHANGTHINYVKNIYAPFTDEDISGKMAEMLGGPHIHAKIELVFQTIEGLHMACPDHPGDWYFSGDYPTPGGIRMVNRAFIDYMEETYLKQENQ